MRDATIYGESARTVLRTLSTGTDHHITESGMYEFELSIGPSEAGPVVRALMRAEAQLLIEDADAFEPETRLRTPGQRRADALMEVVTAAAAALEV